jgi:ubiquitin-protein ligase E3 C
LNNLKENVENLELNFTVDINEFGETRSVELKCGGKEIAVTNDNKIEYIHLLADYKLNRQVKLSTAWTCVF